jgi:hypothetical protein
MDRVVGIEEVRYPMLAVVVCAPSYFDFISYVVAPTSLYMIGLDQRRLSSCIASWIWWRVSLDVSSMAAWLHRWQQGYPAALLRFYLFPLQPPGRGDPGYDVAGEDAPICF